MRLTAYMLIALCAWLPMPAYAQDVAIPLSITVVEGADQIISIDRMPDILVRVTVPGATVKFTVPSESGVTFPGGGTQMTTTSDLQGFARSERMSGTSKGGRFDVRVEASFMGETATVVVHESNGVPADTVKPAHKKSRTVLWIAIIGAAAAGATLVLIKKSDSGGVDSSPSKGSITVGIPTVGAPQ